MKVVISSVAVWGLLFGASAFAQSSPAPDAPAGVDYSKDETWLCRPGRKDSCAVDLSTTVVAADGKLTREPFKANPQAPIDCFYVYPTVSRDTTSNSDMVAGPEEHGVVRAQFARFGSQCKLYAPLYRQLTLAALRAAISGKPLTAAHRAMAYGDVAAAWRHYLKHDNKGRGVVLIGHSQGSGMLTQLIKDEIDGKPTESQLVSALLLGSNVAVPKGKDVGGAFQSVPLCKSASQTGCVITYVSFREDSPPPADSRFGRVPNEGMIAGCVNPAALTSSKHLHAYLSAGPNGVSTASADPKPWVAGKNVETPFVSVPGLLSAECILNDAGSYLSVRVNADPSDPRTDEIVGDVIDGGQLRKEWGLHLIDVHLAMGNLIDIVGQQAQAHAKNK